MVAFCHTIISRHGEELTVWWCDWAMDWAFARRGKDEVELSSLNVIGIACVSSGRKCVSPHKLNDKRFGIKFLYLCALEKANGRTHCIYGPSGNDVKSDATINQLCCLNTLFKALHSPLCHSKEKAKKDTMMNMDTNIHFNKMNAMVCWLPHTFITHICSRACILKTIYSLLKTGCMNKVIINLKFNIKGNEFKMES